MIRTSTVYYPFLVEGTLYHSLEDVQLQKERSISDREPLVLMFPESKYYSLIALLLIIL